MRETSGRDADWKLRQLEISRSMWIKVEHVLAKPLLWQWPSMGGIKLLVLCITLGHALTVKVFSKVWSVSTPQAVPFFKKPFWANGYEMIWKGCSGKGRWCSYNIISKINNKWKMPLFLSVTYLCIIPSSRTKEYVNPSQYPLDSNIHI